MVRIVENTGLYTFVELGRLGMKPLSSMIHEALKLSNNPHNPYSHTHLGRSTSAMLEVTERVLKIYPKPDWNIDSTTINGKTIPVMPKVVLTKPFCKLTHFEKIPNTERPKLLIVAPLSGHYATLLRGTVEATLPFFDVYITEWVDAKMVPASEGKFDFEDYTRYCIDFMEMLSPDLHVLAVCQPAVPVISAVALMSADKSKHEPASMILIGGPIDTQRSPTGVNNYAKSKSITWLEQNVITRVPLNYPGFTRAVYPGFLQLSGFMAMNMKRHMGEHANLYKHLLVGDGESAEHHRKFYNEYLAVLDIPAEFYLQTIDIVFHDHSLPEGRLEIFGKKVMLNQIKNTALMVIEGELDDISGVGQTKAAIDLCVNIPDHRKTYHLQMGVGHYGVFSGSAFRNKIIPSIVEFVDGLKEKKDNKHLKVAK